MPEYEVGIRAFTHVTVEADTPEEAVEEALDRRPVPSRWEVDDTDPVALE